MTTPTPPAPPPIPPTGIVVALRSVPAPPTLGSSPGSTPLVGADRRRLQQARDSLIDCEDALLYVVVHDATLQPLIDRIVEVLMDISRRADVAISAPTAPSPPVPTRGG